MDAYLVAVGGAAGPKKGSSVVLLAVFAPPAPRPVGDIDLLTEAAFSEMHFFERVPQILK